MYSNSIARGGFFPATQPMFASSNPQLMANPLLKDERDDSVLTYYNDGFDFPAAKKRRREATTLAGHSNDLIYVPNGEVSGWCGAVVGDPESDYFPGNHGSVPMMQQQFEIDHLIFLHMEEVKREMEEQRRKQSNRMIRAIQGAVSNKIKVKDEQIEKMHKLNAVLKERLKALYSENQLWRDLARSNEATANALRSKLDQLLTQFNSSNKAGDEADAKSCCGSNGHVAEDEYDEVGSDRILQLRKAARTDGVEQRLMRMCRRCETVESSVLVLPCRHLCLCIACGPIVDACPICNSIKSASVHVNFC